MRTVSSICCARRAERRPCPRAAAINAEHRLAHADAFAPATAAAHGVPLLTGDPEILACNGPWEVVD